MPSLLISILKFSAKWLLPFFLRFFWPIIRNILLWVADRFLTKEKEKIKGWLRTRTEVWGINAAKNEKQADQQAELAETNAQRLKAEARADVWKEIAEQFRRDNVELQIRMHNLEAINNPKSPPKIN